MGSGSGSGSGQRRRAVREMAPAKSGSRRGREAACRRAMWGSRIILSRGSGRNPLTLHVVRIIGLDGEWLRSAGVAFRITFFLFGGGARAAGAGEPRVVWFGLESTKELVQLLLAMCRRWTKAICLLPWQEADGTGLQVPTPCDADSRVRRARQPLCSFHPSISNGNNADHCDRGHHGTARERYAGSVGLMT